MSQFVRDLPAFLPNVPESEKRNLSKIAQQALIYGCPQKYLYLAEPQYLEPDHLKIHVLRTCILRRGDTTTERTFGDQYKDLLDLPGRLAKEKGLTVVINSHPYYNQANLLLWHLVCLLANHRVKSVDPDLYVTHVGAMQVDSHPYNVKPRHVVIYGPCSEDNALATDRRNLTNFLTRFDHYNKIVLTSAKHLSDYLTSCHVDPQQINYIFDVDCGAHRAKEADKTRAKKKTSKKTIVPADVDLDLSKAF